MKRYNLEFLLTWDDDMNPKWHRWNSSLHNSEKMHEYLDRNRLRKYTPQIYTYPKDHLEEIARLKNQKHEGF